jgi:hypothetical protein
MNNKIFILFFMVLCLMVQGCKFDLVIKNGRVMDPLTSKAW